MSTLRFGFTGFVTVVRAGVALVVALFLEFVAVTFVSPLWDTVRSPGEFALGVFLGMLISFGCGCLVALIAGAFAVPIIVVLGLLLMTGGTLVTGTSILAGLAIMMCLAASAGGGVAVMRKKIARSRRD